MRDAPVAVLVNKLQDNAKVIRGNPAKKIGQNTSLTSSELSTVDVLQGLNEQLCFRLMRSSYR